MRIAVIGSGISGLAAAYYLSRQHEVWVYEKEPRIGGHTHTVTVESSRGPLPVDTGFIVHNDRTYPNLIRLFRELGVATAPSDMSFGVSCRRTGFEYSSRGVSGFFARRSNLLRLGQYLLLRDILRFNRLAPRWLDAPHAETLTLGDIVDEGGYSPYFAERYLYPMTAAVWSMSFDAVRSFPAHTLLRFFDNHGLLGINTHPQWRVVKGGSNSYLPALTAPFRDRIVTGVSLEKVARDESGVVLHAAGHLPRRFDHVVFACHGNQVLPLLEAPTDAERDILGQFHTSRNEVTLHTDQAFLPRRRAAWASWNYLLSGQPEQPATLTYHMNRLQSLPVLEHYCVTLNAAASIDPSRVLRRLVYHHPIYTRQAVRAQSRWAEISGVHRTHFCGAYWFYGFHEDGLNSALRVARSLGVDG